MTEEERRSQIRRWFDIPKPEFPTRAVVIGIIMVAAGFALAGHGVFGILLPVAGLVVVGAYAFAYRKGRREYLSRPAVEAMLEWLDQDLGQLKVASSCGFGLNAGELSQDSALVVGPEETPGARKVYEDDDASPRLYPRWKLAMFHFTPGVVAVHQCVYDWRSNNATDERRESIDYQHLVTVRTDADGVGARQFVLSLSNQEHTEIPLRSGRHTPFNEQQLNALADRAVQAIHTAKRDWTAGTHSRGASAATASIPIPSIPSVGSRGRFCSDCGRQLQATERFCPGCGARAQTYR
ncbi:MAG TPA: zinc ribbon domain-containing protein [Bryobacteraceae bacterium]|nr:zinc ribbon domain-containing protein [Bryobacteraceae bacterium]